MTDLLRNGRGRIRCYWNYYAKDECTQGGWASYVQLQATNHDVAEMTPVCLAHAYDIGDDHEPQ